MASTEQVAKSAALPQAADAANAPVPASDGDGTAQKRAAEVRIKQSPEIMAGLAAVSDVCSIILAVVMSFCLSPVWLSSRLGDAVLFGTVQASLCVIAVASSNGYRFNVLRSPLRHAGRVLKPLVGTYCAGLLAAELFLEPEFLNLRWAAQGLLAGCISVLIGRVMVLYIMLFAARKRWIGRRIAILGAGEQGERLFNHLQRDQFNINHVVGVYDDRASANERTADGLTVDGPTSALLQVVRGRQVDDVVVALPWAAEERLRDLIAELRSYPVHIRLGADLAAFQFPGKMSTDVLTGLPMITLSNNPLSGWRRIVKALTDRFFGALLVLLFSPIMLLVAIAIKLDSPGPVLFKQKRLGFNNQTFSVYKFRSMTDDASRFAGKTQQARKADPRITRVGHFIRRTSLDELPQLFNVLHGSMSLIGPRPHALDHNEEYGRQIDNYYARHRVKPGITGLAQVNGLRGETDTLEKMEYRVRYDLHYIENWSILMDLEILALSAFIGFFGRNAY